MMARGVTLLQQLMESAVHKAMPLLKLALHQHTRTHTESVHVGIRFSTKERERDLENRNDSTDFIQQLQRLIWHSPGALHFHSCARLSASQSLASQSLAWAPVLIRQSLANALHQRKQRINRAVENLRQTQAQIQQVGDDRADCLQFKTERCTFIISKVSLELTLKTYSGMWSICEQSVLQHSFEVCVVGPENIVHRTAGRKAQEKARPGKNHLNNTVKRRRRRENSFCSNSLARISVHSIDRV